MSLNNQSVGLADLGRREEALAAIGLVQLAAPMREQASYALPDSRLRLVQRYLELCDQVEREPDEELIQRMYAALMSANVLTSAG